MDAPALKKVCTTTTAQQVGNDSTIRVHSTVMRALNEREVESQPTFVYEDLYEVESPICSHACSRFAPKSAYIIIVYHVILLTVFCSCLPGDGEMHVDAGVHHHSHRSGFIRRHPFPSVSINENQSLVCKIHALNRRL